ncbi:YbbR-like domain-containing protein [Joostella atrarenae]|uniref:YbbR-like domain-containing protein n=1 Tax=Joostella atrarenae TaxID=679257 RepID=A0ABS9J2E3_9FLAO|nr:YbbR-like domain-containing protein [Joostella atrarenae]MCF8714608.1 YbbR-like domain-containing protein [Joostella atrarenae]
MAGRFLEYIKSTLKKPKATIFLMFLVVSFFIWFLISLSDIYTSHISFNLKYNGIPEDKLVLGDPKTSFETNVETSGFKILGYRLFKRDLIVDLVDFHESNNAYYMLPNDLEDAIRTQYKSLNVRRINTDSVVLKLGVNQKKYIKVIPKTRLEFENDYQLRDSIKVEPDSIWVRGPEDIVGKIINIETEVQNHKNVRNNFDYKSPLNIPDSLEELEFETKEVSISGVVERYSEKIILVPVQIANLPDDMSLKVYPEKVKLLCKAPISELKRVNEGAFKVICDYNEISSESTFLIPKLVEEPKFVSSVKILDKKVEYLVKKQ